MAGDEWYFPLPDRLGGVAQGFPYVLRLQVGYALTISPSLMPSATIPTTVATGILNALILGTPPIFSVSTVMRVNAMRMLTFSIRSP